MCWSRVNVAKMPQKFLKTFQTVWFAFSRISFVFPLFELTPAVGADKTCRVELVSHGSDNSSFWKIRKIMRHFLSQGRFKWNTNTNLLIWSRHNICTSLWDHLIEVKLFVMRKWFYWFKTFWPVSCIFSSIALLNCSDMSSLSKVLHGSCLSAIKSPKPKLTHSSLKTKWKFINSFYFLSISNLVSIDVNMLTVTKSSSSLELTVLDTLTVQLYQMGSALGGGGGGLGFLTFLGAVGSKFSQSPNPMYLKTKC